MRDLIVVLHRLILWVLIGGLAVLAVLSLFGCSTGEERDTARMQWCDGMRTSQRAIAACMTINGCIVTSDHLARAMRDDERADARGCAP